MPFYPFLEGFPYYTLIVASLLEDRGERERERQDPPPTEKQRKRQTHAETGSKVPEQNSIGQFGRWFYQGLYGYGSKFNRRGYAGFGPFVHLPGVTQVLAPVF